MSDNKQVIILRLPEIFKRTGLKKTTIYNYIKNKRFPPPFSLGDRAVGWLDYEVNDTLEFMAAGKSNEDIKSLIAGMLLARQAKVADLLAVRHGEVDHEAG
jgi:prophage regulatory protein